MLAMLYIILAGDFAITVNECVSRDVHQFL